MGLRINAAQTTSRKPRTTSPATRTTSPGPDGITARPIAERVGSNR
jgi:hypothetical protein